MNDLPAGDLVGLKVSHKFDKMKEGDAKILKIKDSRILDDDEGKQRFTIGLILFIYFQSNRGRVEKKVQMAECERTHDLKIKSRAYTRYDGDEFLAAGPP